MESTSALYWVSICWLGRMGDFSTSAVGEGEGT